MTNRISIAAFVVALTSSVASAAGGSIKEPPLCPTGHAVDINATVHFSTARSRLGADDRATLDRAMNQIPELDTGYGMGSTTMVVGMTTTGHTDSRGSHRYNDGLGTRRAASVERYLVKKGVPKGTIELISHGERQPVASNSTRSGRAANRRAELTIHTLRAN